MRHSFIALVLAFAAAAASAGEVYKWVDKNGKVHYGDRPKHDAEMVTAKPGAVPGEPLDPEAAKTEAARAAECDRKKKQLESYRAAPSIKETDGLGQTREYSETERQKFIALTEQQVAAACAPPVAAAQ